MLEERNANCENVSEPIESFDILKYSQYCALYHKEHGLIVPRKGAARYIGVSPGSISVWDCTKRYDLQPIRIRNRVWYKVSVLDEFQME
ncbi:MAG: hypothetical protein PSV16_00580 [Flavobacterium sp.]|nr:hypothetical protein [Flavobacterium sp.]